MPAHSGQTINFHQSDSSRSGLASNNRSVAPDRQRRQDGCFAIVGKRKSGLAIHYQNGVLREGLRDAKEEQESSLEGIFQTLRL